MKRQQYLLFRFLLICLLIVTGCGPNIKVTGKVTFSDGNRLEKGRVIFENDNVYYYGMIQKNGVFRLGVVKDGQGIPPGKYRVAVEFFDVEGTGLDETLIHFVAKKYRNSKTSGIEYEITTKTTNISIVVDRPETGVERERLIPLQEKKQK
jgi:hypothetical protein